MVDRNEALTRFQNLLRDLFEFDCADLDFGIYRILNYKREVIEEFITKTLPSIIESEIKSATQQETEKIKKKLEEKKQEIRRAFGDSALTEQGELISYTDTPLGKQYTQLRENAQVQYTLSNAGIETQIYNHLYTFFSRYWQDGDFISKRRYSKKERYAIPYNGEEVYLYWANHDQYYIKTGEHFTDYTWKAPNSITVHFKIVSANVEQNNVKGENRYFIPQVANIEWDAKKRELTIPFEFRPLNQEETKKYGEKPKQETLIEDAEQAICKHLQSNADALSALNAEKRKTENGEPVSYLLHHLRRYTRKNTSDFFIHKDLKGFLSRELDFYIKNEVLNLDDLELAGEQLASDWFLQMRLIKKIGSQIIEFLAQIEEFQKMLWEKRKFVTETFYIITVGNIPEEFYKEIAQNEQQWQAWKELLHIDEQKENNLFTNGQSLIERRLEFLISHPSLPLDTRYFAPDFVDRLLATFENLDERIDGLLIHSENWQALNFLQEKYRERVKCVYIDPPYNTGSDEFLYRDGYQHSSWLTMIENRVSLCYNLIRPDSLSFFSIDDRERTVFNKILRQLFGEQNDIGPMIWTDAGSIQNTEKNIAIVHEYIEAFKKDYNESSVNRRKRVLEKDEYELLRAWGQNSLREDRPTMFYPIKSPYGDVYPIRPDKKEGCWQVSEQVAQNLLQQGNIVFQRVSDGRIEAYRRIPKGTVRESPYGSVISGEGGSGRGTKDLIELFGVKIQGMTAKPVSLVTYLIKITKDEINLSRGESTPCSTILDFFAGSGTTGHAVINLNREDGGRRKFILVEMADYFDTVLLPRLMKVTYSPEWKDGKPKRTATQEEFERGPRILKVIRLESYEDALNNLSFDETGAQKAMEFEDYLLKYMLRWETRKSETMLNVAKLSKPFDYCLYIHSEGETQEKSVDLPETFNYLIGLDVAKREVHHDGERCYLVYRGTTREGKRTVVIWRNIEDWNEQDYERDRQFITATIRVEDADSVYVNGDSSLPNAQSLDYLFKERMFASVRS